MQAVHPISVFHFKIFIIFVLSNILLDMLSYVFQYKFSILLAILIALLSLIPSSSMPDSSLFSIRFLDKIVHFSMYAFFGFVALMESRCRIQCSTLSPAPYYDYFHDECSY